MTVINQRYRILNPSGAQPRDVSEVVNNVMNGKTNNVGTFSLATGWATSTTIYDERIGYNSYIALIPVTDAAEQDAAPFGSFSNSTSQIAPSVGSTAVVIYDTTESSSGVYLSGTGESKIYVRNDGLYNIQYSLELSNADNTSAQYADVWYRLNGADVPRSATRFDLKAAPNATEKSHVCGTVNIFLEMSAGDYVEVAGTTSSTDVGLVSYAADAIIPRPAIPSVILTVNYVAPYSYNNVYVSSQQKGQATVSHFANNTADKTYRYIIVG